MPQKNRNFNQDNLTVGYVRVSTAKQRDEGVSLEAQVKKIETYCELHDIILDRIYIDAGVTGYSIEKRKHFSQLLEDCKNNKIRRVITYSFSRISRKTKDFLTIVDLFNEKDIIFHSITEKVDTDSPTGKFSMTVFAALSQLERDQISERTKMAMEEKKSRGEKTGGYVPYGFTVNLDGILEKDITEQNIIKEIILWRSKRISYREIAKKLEFKKVLNRKGQARWNPGTIQKIHQRM